MFDIMLRKAFVKFCYSLFFLLFPIPSTRPFSHLVKIHGIALTLIASAALWVHMPTRHQEKAATWTASVMRSTYADNRNVRVWGLWKILCEVLSYNKVVYLIRATGMYWAERSLWQQEYKFWAKCMLSKSHKGERDHVNGKSLFQFYQVLLKSAIAEEDTTW